jgi:PIN domain nuclease of toxin-antitoxin system
VRLLLDTAVLIFAVESPELLSRRATAALQSPANTLELSSISLSEIAIKSALGKLRISAAVIGQALEDLGVRIQTYTGDHALHLFSLPLHHRDPFDRQIIAQAIVEGIPVVTPDEKFSLYKGLRLIW